MAAKEPYDYLPTMAPDSNVTLNIDCQGEIREESSKNVVIRLGDDGSEERVRLGGVTPTYYVDIGWNKTLESNAGTIIDFYNDGAKGDGTTKTFKWYHPDDFHTYVVRFASLMTRTILYRSVYAIKSIRLKLMGKI